MKLHHLKYFLGVVDAGSLSKASKQLGVAQPALSQHMSSLERELDTTLLERGRKGVRATPQGEKLYSHAANIMRQIEIAVSEAQQNDDTPSGIVKLLLGPSIANAITPPLIMTINERYPNIKLSIIAGEPMFETDALSEGKIDLAFLSTEHRLENVSTEPIFSDQLHFIGNMSAECASQEPIPFAEVVKFPLILPPRNFHYRRRFDDEIRKIGAVPDIRAEQASLRMTMTMINTGSAFAILPVNGYLPDLRAGKLFARPITHPEIRRTVAIVRPRENSQTAAIDAVCRTLHEIVAELIENGGIIAEPARPATH